MTNTTTPVEQRWTLSGRLTTPWVDELTSAWTAARDSSGGMERVVDLTEVTVIDKSGEQALCAMKKEGAKFIASGIYIKCLLDHLGIERI